jgi:23S rRNA pseudouridine1911/1915/1917 synthase
MNEGFWFETRVGAVAAKVTAMEYLASLYPFRDWRERFASGKVLRNGVVLAGEEVVARGDVVRSFRDPWVEPPIDETMEVLAENAALVVVNKRKDYPVVPHGDFLNHSLLGIVRRAHPDAAPLHRLGRGTTGAIVFAKTNEGARKYCRLFQGREVKKVYRCVVQGVPPWDELGSECFIGPIEHAGCSGGVFGAVPEGGRENKHARTKFSVVKRGDGWAVLDANIFTGRAHQIRIMTGLVGYPLLGDPLYGVGGVPRADGIVFDELGHDRPAAPGDTGYLLHSMVIEIADIKLANVAPPNKDDWAKYCVWW